MTKFEKNQKIWCHVLDNGMGSLFKLEQIKAIKKNIKKLYEQNLLQEQQIQDLAHYLNLTATRVQLHE